MKNKTLFFMASALLTSTLSYCKKRQVGTVIVKDNRILINAYNGTITNTRNKCEYDLVICPICNNQVNLDENNLDKLSVVCPHCGTKSTYNPEWVNHSTDHNLVIHSEQNAIVWAAKNGIPIYDTDMYITDAPCGQCAKLIAQSGIKKVYYMRNYKNKGGLLFLDKIGLPHEKIDESEVINYLKETINV